MNEMHSYTSVPTTPESSLLISEEEATRDKGINCSPPLLPPFHLLPLSFSLHFRVEGTHWTSHRRRDTSLHSDVLGLSLSLSLHHQTHNHGDRGVLVGAISDWRCIHEGLCSMEDRALYGMQGERGGGRGGEGGVKKTEEQREARRRRGKIRRREAILINNLLIAELSSIQLHHHQLHRLQGQSRLYLHGTFLSPSLSFVLHFLFPSPSGPYFILVLMMR